MSAQFDELPLHDAVFYEMRIGWEERTCTVHLAAFVAPGERAQPHALRFQGVTRLLVPHDDPWGPSVFVNGASRDPDGAFRLEMQSGDVIEIHAAAFSFEPDDRAARG